jgi:hypothetical protein
MLQAASKRRDWIQVLVSLNKLQITKLQKHAMRGSRQGFIPSVAACKLLISEDFKKTWPISSDYL